LTFRRLAAVKRTVAGIAAALVVLAGCAQNDPALQTTKPGTRPAATGSTRAAKSTSAHPTSGGPTTATEAACPFLDVATAASDVGVRMGRITVLSSGGGSIGCRFYADQDPGYVASEHLPGPNQPVLQIVSSHYGDETAAHNATVHIAEAGQNAYQANLSATVEGISFQTRFDPADGDRDWAYTFRKGKIVVVVTTVQHDTAFDARAVASDVVAKF
jgi:hypothetical protein